MSVQLVSAPVYRVDCDRYKCPVAFRSTVANDTPDAIRERAARYDWWIGRTGEDLCPSHKAPDSRRLPPGHEWRPVIDAAWRHTLWTHTSRCRARGCTYRAAAELKRKHGDGHRWWAYCAQHMYGRWVADGRVWQWHAVRL